MPQYISTDVHIHNGSKLSVRRVSSDIIVMQIDDDIYPGISIHLHSEQLTQFHDSLCEKVAEFQALEAEKDA